MASPRRLAPRPPLVLIAALLLIGTLEADAGWLDRLRGKEPAPRQQATVFDRAPSLDFAGGVLMTDPAGRYRAGNRSLTFAAGSRIWHGERLATTRDLRLGQRVVVSGVAQADGTLRVEFLQVLPPQIQPDRFGGLGAAPVGELPASEPN